MAKTVVAMAEAAGASPTAPTQSAPTQAAPTQGGPTRQTLHAARSLGSRAQHLRRSVWGPLAVFSGALWLRVTGTFFALIAITMGTAAWRQQSGLYLAAGPFAARRFWVFALFALLFGYFAVSSFIRARLKERRAQNKP